MKTFKSIREWAEARGIYNRGDLKTQTLKLFEEAGELSQAVLNEDINGMVDAIGDCVVVLTNVAEMLNRKYGRYQNKIDIESCIEHAWNEIKDRSGEMRNGTFVKSENLEK